MASSETPRTYQFANERTFVMAQGSVANSTFHRHVVSNSLTPEDCLRDLFLTDPAEDKNVLKRKKGNRAAGTCEWILGTEELTAWLETGQGLTPENPATDILWLYGYPGTGKSIMSIFLAEELSNKFSATDGKTLSYFFCDSSFDKRKTATSVMRGLLWQLLQQHQPLIEYVLPKYAERGPELFKSFDALWAMFMEIAADKATGQKYCIIDALDECDQESQDILLRELWQSFSPGNSSDRVSNIRILITSRPYPEIVEYLGEFANRNLTSFRESQRDIERFIDEKVTNLRRRKHYSDQVTNQVATALKDKAEGTFLWVGFACEELNRVMSKDAVNYLQALPKGLHSLYNRLLDMALKPEGERDTIRCILSFVVASLRPLSLSELSVACQLHEEEDEETRIQFTRDDVASCRLMVIIQDDKVLLLHQSVKDFLVGPGADRFINVLEAHASFAHRCVDQLIRWFKQEPDMAPDDSFRSYSAQFWANHAHMAHSKFIIKASEATFFKVHSDCREHWLSIYRSDFDDRIASRFSIFHVAGHWGICGLVEFALDSQNYRASMPEYVDTDYVDSDGVSPLEEAARSGHKDVITSLLSREKRGSIVRPQIQIAAARNEKNGNEVMALLFDQRGDRISITEEVVKAAMQNWTNGVEVIRLLLEKRGDQVIVTEEVVKAAAQNWMNGTELMILLLDWGEIQVTISEGLVMTMADSFDEQVMARLLNRWGDDITITAEVIKAASGNEQNGKEVVALLLDRRDDQITITEDVVRVAAGNEENGEAIMALLLDRQGDQITITEGVLRAAASNEKSGKEVMALLLDRRGDQITITEGVLRAAASNEKSGKEVMALLLDRRGDQITITEGVLRAAVGKGHIELVKLLLDKGADISILDKDGWTPFQAGLQDIDLQLLGSGADLKSTDIEAARGTSVGGNPAESSGHLELLEPAQATDSSEMNSPAELTEWDYDFPRWRERVTSDLPETIRDNLEYCEVFESGPLWTCTPSKDTPVGEIPLTIGGHPVVIPVEYRYPASAFTMSPPDPQPHSIDPSIEIDENTINDIFEIFEDVLGFYLLINGMLQLIVPDNFDFQYALSHRPNGFGGTRISYIPQTITMTAEKREHGSSSASVEQPLPILPSETRQGNDMSKPASSIQSRIQPHTTSSSGTSSTCRPGHSGSPMDLKIGSMVQARVEGAKGKENFQGKIGLMTEANEQYYLVVSSHVLTQSLAAAKSDRFPGEDWIDCVDVVASNGGQELGRVAETFDPHAKAFPRGFQHDVSLVDVTSVPRQLVTGVASPIPTEWLTQPGWGKIKYTSQNLFLLDSPDVRAKSIGLLGSQCQMVGQAIFKLREHRKKKTRFRFPFAHKKSDSGTNVETWTCLVSRSLLYRVDAALSAPGAQSGTAICIHEDVTDDVSCAKVAGFSSWAQPVSDLTRFDMDDRKLYNRLEEGRVAFYGAFQAPTKLREEHRIV